MTQEGLRRHWLLDPDVTFINHGSFGACPRAVLDAQSRYREQLEREPVAFFVRDGAKLVARARGALGAFVGAHPDDLAFVPNVTTGLNAILASLELSSDDEVLVTDHEYNASRNIAAVAAMRGGAKLVTAPVPFPIDSAEQVLEALLAAVTPRTRVALVDHVTSTTGLVLPLERMIEALHERGIVVVVDGAHAPGMIDLDLTALGADYYAANCHKWLCAPKGAGFIYVPRERQDHIRPAVISHGANAGLVGPARFRREFEWTGTADVTPWLAVEDAIDFVSSLVPGGWPEVRRRNRELALFARSHVAERLGVPLPCPDDMIGSLAAIILPESPLLELPDDTINFDDHPLHEALYERYRVQVPVHQCPGSGQTMVRMSAALYNERADYERLGSALGGLLRTHAAAAPLHDR